MEKVLSKPTPLNLQETVAESVYIARPLVHRILPSAEPDRKWRRKSCRCADRKQVFP